ncbi:hypothetical protein DE146DRAFT_623258 [Phaeosphaeria sp. MPI-PUGE-AT-0046c]|nr:hypothetical protein DE146DRAFT_623258 [Phaeosphaeria sp. MPI-PUGE-AT-0046c]
MRYSTIIIGLLSTIALAAPTALEVRAEPCAPTSYTLSDFTLETSSTYGKVNFKFQSVFASATGIDDSVMTNGSVCHGEGSSVPNNNVCSAPDRKLLFDLRAEQNSPRYQITHTWVCNGQTWMSGNDVTIEPSSLDCNESSGVRKCTASSQTFMPQNVRRICNAPRC